MLNSRVPILSARYNLISAVTFFVCFKNSFTKNII